MSIEQLQSIKESSDHLKLGFLEIVQMRNIFHVKDNSLMSSLEFYFVVRFFTDSIVDFQIRLDMAPNG